MFIIWNGLGFVVLLVIGVGVGLGYLLNERLPNQKWLLFFPVVITAAAIFVIGWRLNRQGDDQEKHSLYFIPVEYWSVIALIAGIIVVLCSW